MYAYTIPSLTENDAQIVIKNYKRKSDVTLMTALSHPVLIKCFSCFNPRFVEAALEPNPEQNIIKVVRQQVDSQLERQPVSQSDSKSVSQSVSQSV